MVLAGAGSVATGRKWMGHFPLPRANLNTTQEFAGAARAPFSWRRWRLSSGRNHHRKQSAGCPLLAQVRTQNEIHAHHLKLRSVFSPSLTHHATVAT